MVYFRQFCGDYSNMKSVRILFLFTLTLFLGYQQAYSQPGKTITDKTAALQGDGGNR